jgi:4-hydroxy-2-oxoheptanedioate aldolase
LSRLGQALRCGHSALGAWLFLGSPDTAEVLAGAGFDALIIDHEHTPGSIETAVHQMRAIRAAGDTTILLRLPGLDADYIKLALDCGAEGLLLPDARSAEQVEALVAACRYPPKGRRGAHFTVSRAARWGAAAAQYPQEYEERLFIAAMIESEQGMREIGAMSRVAGLSMLFLGPLDLSASIGKMGAWEDPAVVALMEEAERSVLAGGLALGGALVPGDTAPRAFARGYRFVTAGSDVGMLRRGAELCLQKT